MDYANILTEIAPILATAGGLLWSFSKKVTRIEAQRASSSDYRYEESYRGEPTRSNRSLWSD